MRPNRNNLDLLSISPALDRSSDKPLHLQLREIVAKAIFRQQCKKGVKLPSERQLAAQFQVDRSTVRRAYQQLEANGIVESHDSKSGLFVSPEARHKLKKPFPTLGIILPEKFSLYISRSTSRLRYLDGIIDRAAELGYATMMLQLPAAHDEQAKRWKEELVQRLAGVIHLGGRNERHDPPLAMILADALLPQVFIGGYARQPHIASVNAEVSIGGAAAAEYLREAGHQRVGMLIQHPLESHSDALFMYQAWTRHQVMADVFRKCRLETRPSWIFDSCRNRTDIVKALVALFKQPDGPTALWCGNDQAARVAVEVIESLGKRVPQDMSIIGYDDSEAAQGVPGLTTIKVPRYTLGYRATEALVQIYEHGLNPRNRLISVPTSLVLRESVAPLMVAAR